MSATHHRTSHTARHPTDRAAADRAAADRPTTGKSPGRVGRGLGVVLACCLAGGCTETLVFAGGAASWYPTPVLAADVATMSMTGKTMVDNIYSFVSGRDCSTIRAMNGDYYCREYLPDNTVIETRLYCYHTLGNITCYDQPQPYQRNQQVAPAQHVIGARTERMAR